MVTSEQIKGARVMLGWSARVLANETGLSLRTIQNIAIAIGNYAIRNSSLLAIKAALEAAGIEFIGAPDDKPGIRIHRADTK